MVSLHYFKQSNHHAISLLAGGVLMFAACIFGVWLARPAKSSPPSHDPLSNIAVTTDVRLGSIRTDRRVYPEPSLPSLPRAGGKFKDPVFGTQIMRVTDARDYPAPGCGTWYSQWPTLNSDNTRLLIRCGTIHPAGAPYFCARSCTSGKAIPNPARSRKIANRRGSSVRR